jgi:voltage-gated sodium channel
MAPIMAHRGAATGDRPGMPAPGRNRLAAIVDAPWFTSTILAVIVVNAIALGLETYPGIDDRWGDALFLLNEVCLAMFVAELALHIAS